MFNLGSPAKVRYQQQLFCKEVFKLCGFWPGNLPSVVFESLAGRHGKMSSGSSKDSSASWRSSNSSRQAGDNSCNRDGAEAAARVSTAQAEAGALAMGFSIRERLLSTIWQGRFAASGVS